MVVDGNISVTVSHLSENVALGFSYVDIPAVNQPLLLGPAHSRSEVVH